jgi:serine/threonine-protein kinase RsbW
MAGERVEDVKVAVTEACTNAVHHAYSGEPGWLTLAAWVDGGLLHLSVRDRGDGFSPESATQAGVGLITIRALARDVGIRSDGSGGTEVTMSFALDGDA